MTRYTEGELLNFLYINEVQLKLIIEFLINNKNNENTLDNKSKNFLKDNYFIIKACAKKAKEYKNLDNNYSGFENSLYIVRHSNFFKNLNKFSVRLWEIAKKLENKDDIKFYRKTNNYTFSPNLDYKWIFENKENIKKHANEGNILKEENKDYYDYIDAMYIIENFKHLDRNDFFDEYLKKIYKEFLDSSKTIINEKEILSEESRAFCKIYSKEIIELAKKGFFAKENNQDYSLYKEIMFIANHSSKLFDEDIFLENIKKYYNNKNLIEDTFNAFLFLNNYKSKIIKLSEHASSLKANNEDYSKYEYILRITSENIEFDTIRNLSKKFRLYIEKRFFNLESQIILSKDYYNEPLFKKIIAKREEINVMAITGTMLKEQEVDYCEYQDAMWLSENCYILLPLEKKVHLFSEILKNKGLSYNLKNVIKYNKEDILRMANKGKKLREENLDYSMYQDAIYITENYHIFDTFITKINQVYLDCTEYGNVKQFMFDENNNKVLNPLSTWLTTNKFKIITLAFEAYYKNIKDITNEELIAMKLMNEDPFINCEDRKIVATNFNEDPFMTKLNETIIKK